MDVHETPMAQDPEILEQNSDSNSHVATDSNVDETTTKMSREDIIAQLKSLVDLPIEEVRESIDSLKQQFYKTPKVVSAPAEEGEESVEVVDPLDEELKQLLTLFREKRAAYLQAQEDLKNQNLAAKKEILEQIKLISEDSDNINKQYAQFQQLQQSFKEIVNIPAAAVNEMWKSYQMYVENFYDLLKINKELRDYDFKKNLDIKTAICQQTEELDAVEDVVEAFKSLQQLHEEWRATGPVAKELREELWSRFKAASTIINKKHQSHFENIKERETANEQAKTQLCEEIEQIETASLKTFNDWEEKTQAIIELQARWKNIGFASRKANNLLFERFRKSCDIFFEQKAEFYKAIKEELNQNLEKKKALCEKAEALKDSTDWKKTTDQLIALQKEWKTVGPVAKKYSTQIWKRFSVACDYFFEQKGQQTSSQKQVELENLRLKKEVIESVKGVDTELTPAEAIKLVKALMAQWNSIGHVPFKEKDKIYGEYQAALDAHFSRLNMQENKNRLNSFTSSINKMAAKGENGANRLYREREKLAYALEQKKGELATYENNMGFLSISSKSGNSMLKEMERKMQKLREEMDLITQKINTLDHTL